jgi:GMP synthase-like glutamine amidotransferase
MESYQFVNEKNLDQFHKMLSTKIRNGFVIVEHNEKLPYVVLSKEKKAIKHSFHLFF